MTRIEAGSSMSSLDDIRTPEDLRSLNVDQLQPIADQIRTRIIEQVSRTGGHLAPNLGVVELTVAMHYVFDFAHDRLLFDVGHQCYPHKLLTGRASMLSKLRTREGMAGFPEPRESAFDLFSVGHAGTAISTAVGIARGDKLLHEGYHSKRNPDGRRVVSLVGDASIVNGVSMEGLNNAGTLKRQMLVVLNDNGMSISHPQGALADYFDRVRLNSTYTDIKRRAKSMLDHLPGGSLVEEGYHRMTESLKAFVSPGGWFEHFGLLTVGPFDGHDIPMLVEFLREAKDVDRPLVFHVKTIKGKGLEYAEQDATTFHSPAAHTYDPESCRVEIKKSGRSFTTAFADALSDVMDRDEKVIAATAAMPGGTGLDVVGERFPERVFDTGICESHAMDMMAGMAKSGLKPFFAVYSTFLQRAFDQAFQEVALQGLPVRLCLDRAGLVGGDGAVHHGFCDVAILSSLPNAVLMAAIDEHTLHEALEFMRTHNAGLSCVRYPRDNVSPADEFRGDAPAFELGKAHMLRDSGAPDVAVLAFGVPALAALEAAEQLAPEANVDVYDARFAKPVDRDLIRSLLLGNIPIVTVEDHSVVNGFGAQVLSAANQMGLDTSRIHVHGLPDRWVYQDSRGAQLTEVGLDAQGIARVILQACNNTPDTTTGQQPDTERDIPHIQA